MPCLFLQQLHQWHRKEKLALLKCSSTSLRKLLYLILSHICVHLYGGGSYRWMAASLLMRSLRRYAEFGGGGGGLNNEINVWHACVSPISPIFLTNISSADSPLPPVRAVVPKALKHRVSSVFWPTAGLQTWGSYLEWCGRLWVHLDHWTYQNHSTYFTRSLTCCQDWDSSTLTKGKKKTDY